MSHSVLKDCNLDLSDIIWQQDNDLKHTSRFTLRWFEEHHAHILPWPPYSPDMNIIEHVWDLVKRIVEACKEQPQTLDELWEVVQQAWYSIDVKAIQNLYRSLPRRTKMLAEVEGHNTKLLNRRMPFTLYCYCI
jgi:hypothetical protein